MKHFQNIAVRELPTLLEEWLGVPVQARSEHKRHDLLIDSPLGSFLIEIKGSDDIAVVEQGSRQLKSMIQPIGALAGILAVPYMGPKAREYARTLELSWLDLSGNADIRAPGLRVLIEGRSNRFASAGRPSTVFSPKASRLTRVLLMEVDRWWLQNELAVATDLSPGFISKLVRRMLEDELLIQGEEGRIRPRSPAVLLDAWAQEYDFRKHHLSRFHAVGRTGQAVLKNLAEKMETSGLRWATTGLAAAWIWTQHADFRLVTVYTSEPLHEPEAFGLRGIEKGENVWVVVPHDEGVFDGSQRIASVQCVHPVQAWLDLQEHPERAKEAASRLRADLLQWRL